jgi:hypothetical protein
MDNIVHNSIYFSDKVTVNIPPLDYKPLLNNSFELVVEVVVEAADMKLELPVDRSNHSIRVPPYNRKIDSIA